LLGVPCAKMRVSNGGFLQKKRFSTITGDWRQ
jgi:hypothetical protein